MQDIFTIALHLGATQFKGEKKNQTQIDTWKI